jgi:hypothetical protein
MSDHYTCGGCGRRFDGTFIHNCVDRPGHAPPITPEVLNAILAEGRELSAKLEPQLRGLRPESPEAEVARLRAEIERLTRERDAANRAFRDCAASHGERVDGLFLVRSALAAGLHEPTPDAATRVAGERDAYREALSALVDAVRRTPPRVYGNEYDACDEPHAEALRKALVVLGRTA